MPQQPNAVRAGTPVIRKIPTGKQVAKPQPEPEPEPEVYTLDQLLIAQIIEGINNIAYNFPEGDPRLLRLFQARMCLIDYAGLEILTEIEKDAARRQAVIMAQIQGRGEDQSTPQPPQPPRRRSRGAEEIAAEFKTTGDVVKNLVSDEGDGDMQSDIGEVEPGAELPEAEMPEEGGAGEVAAEGEAVAEGELSGDEGPMDPFEQDILENPDAALPGLEGIPHMGGRKELQPQQKDGPETRESRSLVARILNKEKNAPQPIASPPGNPAKQPPKGKQPPVRKDHIDSVG